MKEVDKEVVPYNDGDGEKKEQVRRMFDGIAPHYDSLNALLSAGMDRRWRKRAIERLQAPDQAHILDVATGTGDLAFEIAKQYPSARVTGLDIANEMLEIARVKSARKELQERIDFILGDSENLPFDDNTFDGVTVAFGVRNFGNLDKGLSEINRVLKPGGRLVVLEFTKPRIFPFKQLFAMYFKNILPRIGGMKSGDKAAYKYLYDSVQAFPDYEKFTAVLGNNNFHTASFKDLTLGICAIYTAEK